MPSGFTLVGSAECGPGRSPAANHPGLNVRSATSWRYGWYLIVVGVEGENVGLPGFFS